MGKNNVNPNHYQTAGRERQGGDIVQEIHKQEYAQANVALGRKSSVPAVPGAAGVVAARVRPQSTTTASSA